ncbi:MAG: DUF5655 domain-containing protein [Dehalococcoidia bacterium]
MTEAAERWTCPKCNRSFGRPNRPHTCVPALSADEYFATRTAAQRRIYDAVVAHVQEFDAVEIEAVYVGILMKRSRTFAELRPKRDGFRLSVLLERVVEHPRISRTSPLPAHRVAHFVVLRDAGDVDDQLRAWLTEACLSVPP